MAAAAQSTRSRPQPGLFAMAPLALSDEEAVSLSARLVEAKHEETQARAEADSLVGGADFDEDEAEALHEAHEIAEHEEHGHHEEESEEEQDEREEREDREDAEEEAHETQLAAETGHSEQHEEAGEEGARGRKPRGADRSRASRPCSRRSHRARCGGNHVGRCRVRWFHCRSRH